MRSRNGVYRFLFLMGLLFEAIGQLLLSYGNDFVYALEPIDFAHWSLLLGVVLMIPQISTFPQKVFSYIGMPIALIGVVCIIGMCVLDFIWWSMETQEIRNEFAAHISNVPSIWKPFITTGPNFLNIGLMILSFNYVKESKIGIIIIVLATMMLFNLIPVPFKFKFLP